VVVVTPETLIAKQTPQGLSHDQLTLPHPSRCGASCHKTWKFFIFISLTPIWTIFIHSKSIELFIDLNIYENELILGVFGRIV
jgi:hypothetical protein